MTAEKKNKFSFKISADIMSEKFLANIKDLTKITDNILIRFSPDNILMYATVGEGRMINAFKCYMIDPVKDLKIDKIPTEEFQLIIKDAKKFVRNATNFVDLNEVITFELGYNKEMFCDKFTIKNSKLRIVVSTGDPITINTSLSVDKIREVMDISMANFSFSLKSEDYDRTKKLAMGDSKVNDFVSITVEDNIVKIGEYSWNLNVSETEWDDCSITIPKKYYTCITFNKEENTIHVFDTFILIESGNSNLLVSIETSI